MRLFVAVPVPADTRRVIADALAPSWEDPRLAWTRPEGWHVTLAFIGEVATVAPATAAVTAGCRMARVRPDVVATTAGAIALGRATLAVEITDTPRGTLARLGQDIQTALADAGVGVTRRAVHPHLTLGRARRRRPVPRDLLRDVAVPAVSWAATHVDVCESLLGDKPATYRLVAAVALSEP